MTQVGYPDLVQHLSIHGALSDQASRLIMNINIDDLNSTVQFLVEWLEQHIMVEDMKFKHYVS
jgi:hemerythrin